MPDIKVISNIASYLAQYAMLYGSFILVLWGEYDMAQYCILAAIFFAVKTEATKRTIDKESADAHRR